MKVNVEVDCTPEEMRRLAGLPDLTPLHDRYVALVSETMEGKMRPEMIEALMQSWAPMGETAMNLWKRMIETGTKSG